MLMVGPAWQDCIRVGIGKLNQLLPQAVQGKCQRITSSAEPEANIRGDLVITAAAGMQFPSNCRSEALA
jgi:hypothetical protein